MSGASAISIRIRRGARKVSCRMRLGLATRMSDRVVTRSSRATATRSGTSTRWASATASGRSAARSESTAFGVNAIALPPGYETGRHFHDAAGGALLRAPRHGSRSSSATATTHTLEPGRRGPGRPATVRKIRNVGDEDAVYVIVGAKDGYVGRDGRLPEGETSRFGPAGSAGGRSLERRRDEVAHRLQDLRDRRSGASSSGSPRTCRPPSTRRGSPRGWRSSPRCTSPPASGSTTTSPGLHADTLEWLDKLAPPSWQEPANDVARELSPDPGDYRHHARRRGQRRRPPEEPPRPPPGDRPGHRRPARPRPRGSRSSTPSSTAAARSG